MVDVGHPETPWGDQDENGVDLTWLRYNLTLTDDQKLEQHRRAAEFIGECMDAAKSAGIQAPDRDA